MNIETFIEDKEKEKIKRKLSYRLYKPKNMKLNPIEKIEKIKKVKRLKKNFSTKQTFKNFYKSLKSTWSQSKRHFYPSIIDKNTFNFNLSDENSELIKRTFIINKGNLKHNYLTKIANKKEIEKINSAKEFRNRMKIMKNNLEIIKKKNLEEKIKINKLILFSTEKKKII